MSAQTNAAGGGKLRYRGVNAVNAITNVCAAVYQAQTVNGFQRKSVASDCECVSKPQGSAVCLVDGL